MKCQSDTFLSGITLEFTLVPDPTKSPASNIRGRVLEVVPLSNIGAPMTLVMLDWNLLSVTPPRSKPANAACLQVIRAEVGDDGLDPFDSTLLVCC